ncbi:MAG: hypothetical protein R3182_10265, partial [Draconibacterium sp.]|nr:hypothetical protein [Draconibacterium sp.]
MKYFITFLILIIVISNSIIAQKIYDNPNSLWKPQKDEVYLQEVSIKIPTEKEVTSVAHHNGIMYALMDEQIFIIQGNQLLKTENTPEKAIRFENKGGDLWLIAADGLYKKDANGWIKVSNLSIIDITEHNGKVHAATREEIFIVEKNKLISTRPEGGYYNNHLSLMKEDGTQMHVVPVRLGPIDQIESFAG